MSRFALLLVAVAAIAAVANAKFPPPVLDVEDVDREVQWVILKDERLQGLKSLLRTLNDFPIKKFFGRKKQFTVIAPSNDTITKFLNTKPSPGNGNLAITLLGHIARFRTDISDLSKFDTKEVTSKQGKIITVIDSLRALDQLEEDDELPEDIEQFIEDYLNENSADDLEFKVNRWGFYVNGNKINKAIRCKNGIVYLIDGIIPADDMFNSPDFVIYQTLKSVASALTAENERNKASKLNNDKRVQDVWSKDITKFASIFQKSERKEGRDLIYQLSRRGPNKNFIVLAPINKYARRAQKYINNEKADFKHTKFVMEHIIDVGTGFLNRNTIIAAIKARGSPLVLNNMMGRPITMDFRVNRNGIDVLTANGFDIANDLADIGCTNGLILQMEGWFQENYGRGDKL